MEESRIRDALLFERWICEQWAVVPVDARMIEDPDQTRSRHHIGTHPAVLASIVHSAQFRGWLDTTMRRLCEALDTDLDTVVLALYCKGGNHRSVACATVLEHLLQATNTSVRMYAILAHLSKPMWQRHRCGQCVECRGRHPDRDAALAAARGLWAGMNGRART